MKVFSALNFLFGFLLTDSIVVADEASPIATGNKTLGDPRRVFTIQSHASATDAVSATTSNLSRSSVMNTLPTLPAGVRELQFNEFFRQPIGPRGLESTLKLRNLDGGRIQIPGYEILQSTSVQEEIAGVDADAGYGH